MRERRRFISGLAALAAAATLGRSASVLAAPRAELKVELARPAVAAGQEVMVDVTVTTFDGSDPRLSGGGISPTATPYSGSTQQEVLVAQGADWSFLDDGSDQGASDIVLGNAGYGPAHWKHPDFDDAGWASGPAPLGYGVISGRDLATTIGYGPSGSDKHITTYFRHSFSVTGASRFLSLTLRVMRDDGAIVYLNGREVARSDFPAGTTVVGSETLAVGVSGSPEGVFHTFAVPVDRLVEGINTLAVEVHNASPTSSDLGLDLELAGLATAVSDVIAIADDTLIRARALDAGEWSALDEALFLVGSRAEDLYVSELMFHPAPGGAEYLEIANRGSVTHALADLCLSGGIDFDFAASTATHIAPGERLVLVRDTAAFTTAYPGVSFAGEYDGALNNGGDTFSLEQSDATVLWTVSYGDDAPWPGGTDGGGHSLVYVTGDPNSASSWRPSVATGGNPAATDSIALQPGEDLIDYAGVVLAAGMSGELAITTTAGTDEAAVQPEWSSDMVTWTSAGLSIASRSPDAEGHVRETWLLDAVQTSERVFFRATVTERR